MRNILGLCVVLLISMDFCGCSSSDELSKRNEAQIIRSTSRPIQLEDSESRIIRRSDRIQLSMWGYPEFNFADTVKESGVILVPLLGEMNVAGLSKGEFTELLKQRLAEYIHGEVKLTLSVISAVVQKVAVLGAVVRQENYPLTSDTPLLEVLTMAGGLTAESDLRHVRILRADLNRPPIEVDLAECIETGNISAIPVVRPGDTVLISKKENFFREVSEYLRDVVFLIIFFNTID